VYSGISWLSGRWRCDLFNARVPYLIIKKAGRWKSDVALTTGEMRLMSPQHVVTHSGALTGQIAGQETVLGGGGNL
jgi:hypothetical protein